GFAPEDAWTAVIRFPGWATIPGYYNLAEARDWHNLAAWPFALALLGIWIAMLLNRHFWRDIATSPGDWKPSVILQSIATHWRSDPRDPEARYNSLQRIVYGLLLGIALPMMVVTGLAISPGFEPAAPWLVDLLGGRQSARSLHFIFAFAIALFFVLHLLLVLVSGPIRRTLAMITGGELRESGHA
ncbi:MAG: cytochrome b/b6 domain-containing protein, partial [Pseudomonadota bacterium]